MTEHFEDVRSMYTHHTRSLAARTPKSSLLQTPTSRRYTKDAKQVYCHFILSDKKIHPTTAAHPETQPRDSTHGELYSEKMQIYWATKLGALSRAGRNRKVPCRYQRQELNNSPSQK